MENQCGIAVVGYVMRPQVTISVGLKWYLDRNYTSAANQMIEQEDRGWVLRRQGSVGQWIITQLHM